MLVICYVLCILSPLPFVCYFSWPHWTMGSIAYGGRRLCHTYCSSSGSTPIVQFGPFSPTNYMCVMEQLDLQPRRPFWIKEDIVEAPTTVLISAHEADGEKWVEGCKKNPCKRMHHNHFLWLP